MEWGHQAGKIVQLLEAALRPDLFFFFSSPPLCLSPWPRLYWQINRVKKCWSTHFPQKLKINSFNNSVKTLLLQFLFTQLYKEYSQMLAHTMFFVTLEKKKVRNMYLLGLKHDL